MSEPDLNAASQKALEAKWPKGTRVVAAAYRTPRGRVLPEYRGTVTGHTPEFVVVRNDATRRRRCHQSRELTVEGSDFVPRET